METGAEITALAAGIVIGFYSLSGCDDGGTPTEEDPGEHACEQVGVVPRAVAAGAARDTSAPEAVFGEPGYDVALPAGAVGYLRLEIATETEALAFTANAHVLSALYHGTDEEEVTSSGPNERCPGDIAEHFHLDFHELGTYFLELGPTATDAAWLVLLPAAGHEH